MTFTAASARALSALSAGLLALGTLAACTPEPAPQPTKTALFASDAEAFKAAEETYRAYVDAYNTIDTTEVSAFETTRKYLTGRYAAAERKTLSEFYAEKWKQTGTSTLIFFAGKSYERPDRILARVCSDVSATDVLNSAGESMVSPDRPERYALDIEFKVQGQSILIADSQAIEDDKCVSADS